VKFFYEDDLIIVTTRVHRTQSVSAVFFTHSFTTCQVLLLNTIATYEYSIRKMNIFSNETCLNSTHQCFIYRSNLFKHLLTHVSQTVRNSTAAITVSVVKTTHWSARSFSSTTLSHPRANFLHQTCIAGLVKHLSSYTGRISE